MDCSNAYLDVSSNTNQDYFVTLVDHGRTLEQFISNYEYSMTQCFWLERWSMLSAFYEE